MVLVLNFLEVSKRSDSLLTYFSYHLKKRTKFMKNCKKSYAFSKLNIEGAKSPRIYFI